MGKAGPSTRRQAMSNPNLSTRAIDELRKVIKGRVIEPGAADYDGARAVFYGGIDRKPAVIVRVANAADIGKVILLAGNAGAELAVKSGGHSVAGHSVSEGGIVLDLSQMRSLEMDEHGR